MLVRTSSLALLLLAVLSLVAAGCGRDTGSDRLSKGQYIEQVNRINRQLEDATGRLGESATESPGKAGDTLAGNVRNLDRSIKRLRKLKPPREWDKHHKELIAAVAQVRDGMKLMATAKQGDAQALRAGFDKIAAGHDRSAQVIDRINADR